MNETLKTIAGRYSCRDFSNEQLTAEQVDLIVKAAAAAPSAMNLQPWQIIVVTDKAFIEEMDSEGMGIIASAEDKSLYERIKSRGGKMFYNAPCMFMIACGGSKFASMDCGILSQNVTLAAHSIGLGSVICAMAGIPLNGPRGAELKQRLKFPDGYEFGIAILIGHAKSSGKPHALDLNKVTYIRPE